MAPIANFTKKHFDEVISNALVKSDLISQLQDLDQPTHGLKSKLQARLQLAYLGHAEPELEDQLSSIFSLSKGPLQEKCTALKIYNVQGKTMPALRRLVVMALCGIPIPAEGQEMDVDRSPTVQHHLSSPDIIMATFAPTHNPIIPADILAVDEAPVSRAQTQQAAQVAGPIAAATCSVQTRQTTSAQQHQAQQHQGMKYESPIAATTRSVQTRQTLSAQQHQAQHHQGMKSEGPIAAASAVPASQAPTPQHQTVEPAAAAIETPVPMHTTTTPAQPEPPSPVVASIPLPPPRALPQQKMKMLSSAESEIITLLDDFLWRTKGLGMGRLNASDRVYLKALVYRFTDKFDDRVREARDRQAGGME